MTEVKTIGDYINALPDEIREEVRRLNAENSGEDESNLLDSGDLFVRHNISYVLDWLFLWPNDECEKWEVLADKYTLTEKEGKYYTNW